MQYTVRGLWMPAVLVATVLVGASARPAPAESENVYVGTVAGQKVVAQLDVEAGRVRGGLFAYTRYGRTIELQDAAGGRLVECPDAMKYPDCPDPSGVWEVRAAQRVVTGAWKAKANDPRTQRIRLRRTSRSYGAVLLADNRIVTIGENSAGAVAWKQLREERSRVSYPMLTRAPVAAAMQRVNAQLHDLFSQDILAAFESFEYDARMDVLFASARLFTIGGHVGYDGGGAHPSNQFVTWTFDLKTGKALDWKELLRVPGDGTTLDLARRDVLAAPALRAVVRAASAAGDQENWCMDVVARMYDCDDTLCRKMSVDGALYWSYYPTARGLAVVPDVYSEAERVCRGTAVIVPWPEVRPTARGPLDLLPR